MLDAGLAEIVANLRVLGTDIAGVELKNSHGGLPRSLRETLSAFSSIRGGVVILGLDEGPRVRARRASDPHYCHNFATALICGVWRSAYPARR